MGVGYLQVKWFHCGNKPIQCFPSPAEILSSLDGAVKIELTLHCKVPCRSRRWQTIVWKCVWKSSYQSRSIHHFNFFLQKLIFLIWKLIAIWPNKYLSKNPTITIQQKSPDTLLLILQNTQLLPWKILKMGAHMKKVEKNLWEDKEARAIQNYPNQPLC